MEYKNYDTIYMCGYTFGGKYCPLFSCALILICILLFRENKKQRKKCGHVKIGVTKSDNEEWAKQRETTKKMT